MQAKTRLTVLTVLTFQLGLNQGEQHPVELISPHGPRGEPPKVRMKKDVAWSDVIVTKNGLNVRDGRSCELEGIPYSFVRVTRSMIGDSHFGSVSARHTNLSSESSRLKVRNGLTVSVHIEQMNLPSSGIAHLETTGCAKWPVYLCGGMFIPGQEVKGIRRASATSYFRDRD